ncbi:hypothetical protein DI53_0165 [Sphingobacterium deserti]|uniref:Uncharacterized protein n=1 Tax=Sphingobacterium deserti TaxID=1229276 RepID=A0A0B8TCD7_9SPHI|nr:hypothetical protein DI53_0165 [Sphingobacterium deserti]
MTPFLSGKILPQDVNSTILNVVEVPIYSSMRRLIKQEK